MNEIRKFGNDKLLITENLNLDGNLIEIVTEAIQKDAKFVCKKTDKMISIFPIDASQYY